MSQMAQNMFEKLKQFATSFARDGFPAPQRASYLRTSPVSLGGDFRQLVWKRRPKWMYPEIFEDVPEQIKTQI